MNRIVQIVTNCNKRFSVTLGIILLFAHFKVALAQKPDSVSLKALAAKHNLLIGGATDLNHNDVNEEWIILREYSILSNENCLKPHNVQPVKSKFDFKQSDSLVGFCKKNNLIAKGHKLVGRDAYLPAWMLDSTLNRNDLQKILTRHIKKVMGRYKKGSRYGRIHYWDVLNEVIAYPCVFEKIGKNEDGDFLYWELAFRTARAVDPSCILIWNEDNTEFDQPKGKKLYETIKRLKARGVPIDGVGFQCHLGLVGQPLPDYIYLAEIFQKFADLGLYIAITESDVSEQLDQVGLYQKTLQVCLDQPKCIMWNTWNVVDKYSWRRTFLKEAQNPLLFDDHYQPKPTYDAVQTLLKEANKNAAKRKLPTE